ncbi:MAG: class I SAM-dependent methyltransferase [Coriobacteriia bacterium]|nr:class I SAM-dependent methyltransferase [Coriobacteriia bacterium]MBN2821941.1 class I SAM-dependent methyltransferase [Coriobacteriia bacterium]
MQNEYALLDSGEGRKLERFGYVVLSRPCEQAVWERQDPEAWAVCSASFDREHGWTACGGAQMPDSWVVTINDITMRLKPSPAGHLGVFPETRELWGMVTDTLRGAQVKGSGVLNLFAYSGGATMAAARAGFPVCHLDSSKSMVTRARDNAALNHLGDAPIRWIVEDVNKFLDREIRRGRRYDAIMLDPPSFGRGARGEQYKIDRDLVLTLEKCKALLTEKSVFLLLTSHTRGVTAPQLEGVVGGLMGRGKTATGEMELTGATGVRAVSSGVWVQWKPEQ